MLNGPVGHVLNITHQTPFSPFLCCRMIEKTQRLVKMNVYCPKTSINKTNHVISFSGLMMSQSSSGKNPFVLPNTSAPIPSQAGVAGEVGDATEVATVAGH